MKQARRELQRLVHPSAEVSIKLNGKVVRNDVVYTISRILLGVYRLHHPADRADDRQRPRTRHRLFRGCRPPQQRRPRPRHGQFQCPPRSASRGKWILIFAMLLGRLEVFTLLVMFTPAFWRR